MLHLREREAIRLVQLVDRVKEVSEAAAGHAQDLVVAEGCDVADKALAKLLHVDL